MAAIGRATWHKPRALPPVSVEIHVEAVDDSPPPAALDAPAPAPPDATPPPATARSLPPDAAPDALPPPAAEAAATPSPAPVQTGLTLRGTSRGAMPVTAGSAGPGGKKAAGPRAARPSALAATCSAAPTKARPLSKQPAITYSGEAQALGIEGRLVLRVWVGAQGQVQRVQVLQGLHTSVDRSAAAAVRQWRFAPATRCGQPIDGGTYTLARSFELSR